MHHAHAPQLLEGVVDITYAHAECKQTNTQSGTCEWRERRNDMHRLGGHMLMHRLILGQITNATSRRNRAIKTCACRLTSHVNLQACDHRDGLLENHQFRQRLAIACV